MRSAGAGHYTNAHLYHGAVAAPSLMIGCTDRACTEHQYLGQRNTEMQVVQQPVAEGSKEPGSSGPEGLGYTLWMYDGDQWQVKKDCALEDGETGQAPTSAGKFKGQLRATACV